MSALLLKDWYMMRKYCRVYLLLALVFFGVYLAAYRAENLFFVIYPCLFAGLLPRTLLAYDENSRWDRYCAALPFTKDRVVTEKYLLSLILASAAAAVSAVVIAAGQALHGGVSPSLLAQQLVVVLSAGLLAPVVSLPLTFRYGVEKGRIAGLVVIAVVCGAAVAIPEAVSELTPDAAARALPLALPAALALFALSWRLSLAFYRDREL